jgi:hypothetical protein
MSAPASVLLWGGRGAGKSGFVGALWHAGGAHDDAGGRWCISPGDLHDEYTKDYLIDAYAMLRDRRRRATMPAPEYPHLRMTARRWIGGSPRAALELAFRDPAGEYAEDPLRARQQGGALLDGGVSVGVGEDGMGVGSGSEQADNNNKNRQRTIIFCTTSDLRLGLVCLCDVCYW